jgi:hypothetical protein
MTYKAKAAVCSEICTSHSTQSEHQVEFLNPNLPVRKETARLWKANAVRVEKDVPCRDVCNVIMDPRRNKTS